MQNALRNNSRVTPWLREKMLPNRDSIDSILKATVVKMMMILVG